MTWFSPSALLLRSGCEHILALVVIVILWFPLIQFNIYFLWRVCCFSVCFHPCCLSRLEGEVEMLWNGGYRNEWKVLISIFLSLYFFYCRKFFEMNSSCYPLKLVRHIFQVTLECSFVSLVSSFLRYNRWFDWVTLLLLRFYFKCVSVCVCLSDFSSF